MVKKTLKAKKKVVRKPKEKPREKHVKGKKKIVRKEHKKEEVKKVVKEVAKKEIKHIVKKEVPKKEATKREVVKKESVKKRPKGVIFTTGKRKRAIARASVKPGSGKVLINGKPLENYKNEVLRLRLQEPLILTGKDWQSYDFNVSVRGGGMFGQTDAARQSIARGLVEIFGSELKQKFLDYDRNLLVYDPRRTEPHKPPRSSQGPRRYKQRSKR